MHLAPSLTALREASQFIYRLWLLAWRWAWPLKYGISLRERLPIKQGGFQFSRQAPAQLGRSAQVRLNFLIVAQRLGSTADNPQRVSLEKVILLVARSYTGCVLSFLFACYGSHVPAGTVPPWISYRPHDQALWFWQDSNLPGRDIPRIYSPAEP